jgi:predicted O-methyltransferase YrrM
MDRAPSRIHELARGTDGWLSVAEADLLYRLAHQCRAGCIVEIGSYRGRSTTFLGAGSDAGGRVPVYAIDPHVDPATGKSRYVNFARQIERAGLGHIVRPMISTSASAAPRVSEPVELLFIDGAHDLASVQQDWDLWVPKVIPGGYVALHDTLKFRGPRIVAEARLLGSDGFVNRGVADSITFGKKRRDGDPVEPKSQRLRIMTLKRICNLGARLRMPALVKEWGSRALAGLQR